MDACEFAPPSPFVYFAQPEQRNRFCAGGVDVTIAASQKGLMTPAGVSFNFVNDKALARRKALRRRVSSYWDWVPRIEIPLGFCAQLLPLATLLRLG